MLSEIPLLVFFFFWHNGGTFYFVCFFVEYYSKKALFNTIFFKGHTLLPNEAHIYEKGTILTLNYNVAEDCGGGGGDKIKSNLILNMNV